MKYQIGLKENAGIDWQDQLLTTEELRDQYAEKAGKDYLENLITYLKPEEEMNLTCFSVIKAVL